MQQPLLTHPGAPRAKRALGWLSGVVALGVVVLATSAGALAWGPERPTYTIEKPADHVTFNSITNNPAYGDERNFVRIKEAGAPASAYSDDTKVEPGKDYEVYVYYHNNASKTLNDDAHGKKGIAQNARLRMALPAGLKANQRTGITGYLSADNATPKTVHDNSYLTSGTDVALRYIPGSATIASKGGVNGQKLPDALFSQQGAPLGFDSLNGLLPGCNEFSGYVTFKFRADAPNFTIKKQVRKAGEQTWQDKIVAKVGEKVEFLISYQNTGSTQQNDVIVKDALPAGLTYQRGSSVLANSVNAKGAPTADDVTTKGLNIGAYSPRGNAGVRFSTTVDKPAVCGNRQLTNHATIITANGNKQASAVVEVESPCAPNECKPGIPNGDARCESKCQPGPGQVVDKNGNCVAAPTSLPTTGPTEVVLGLIGIALLVAGVVYWYRSQKDLKHALVGESTSLPSAPAPRPTHTDDEPKQ